MTSKNFQYLLSFFCFSLIILLQTSCKSDSDEELIKIFKINQSEFNKLIKMLETDTHLIRVDPTFTWQSDREKLIYQESAPNFTEQRWNEYRELFAQLKLKQGLIRYKNPELIIFFIEENKGIAYCNCELEPLYESLDNIDSTKITSSRALYRKIEKGWYVYYQPSNGNWGKNSPQKNTENENQTFHQVASIRGL